MTMIEAVRQWLSGYEGLSDSLLHIDYLPPDAETYSVDTIPAKEIVKQYLDGTCLKQFLFAVSSREFHGEDLAQNGKNYAFFDGLIAWITQQRKAKTLPELGEGRTARRVEVNSSPYLFFNAAGTARYQLQLTLTYYEKG